MRWKNGWRSLYRIRWIWLSEKIFDVLQMVFASKIDARCQMGIVVWWKRNRVAVGGCEIDSVCCNCCDTFRRIKNPPDVGCCVLSFGTTTESYFSIRLQKQCGFWLKTNKPFSHRQCMGSYLWGCKFQRSEKGRTGGEILNLTESAQLVKLWFDLADLIIEFAMLTDVVLFVWRSRFDNHAELNSGF